MGTLVRRNDRREIRRAVKLYCRAVDANLRRVGDRTIDISPEGMLLQTYSPLQIGDKLLVSFRATDLDLWFDTDATVARVLHGRRSWDSGRAVGVTFHSLSAVHRLILRGHFRKIPPPLPKRAQRIDYASTVRKIISIPSF